jgi:acetyl-CoA carboxylase biotin carboxyl carrier protein
MAQAWRHARLNALGASLPRVHEIRAEITANVWQVAVDEGQMVAEGDEIVILESMKMEIPVVTEVPGVVRELHVQPEDVIQEGDLIALIDES